MYSLEMFHHPLHQGRGIYKTEGAVAKDEPFHHVLYSIGVRVDRGKADALAGDGEFLGIGGDDDAVAIGLENAGQTLPVIQDFPVWFIGYEINGFPQRTALALEQPPQFAYALLVIDPALFCGVPVLCGESWRLLHTGQDQGRLLTGPFGH